MDDALDQYTRVSAGFDARVRGVRDDQWMLNCPTCPDWDVRALVGHVVGNHHRMLETVGRQPSEDLTETDPQAAWSQARAAVLTAVGDPAVASQVVPSPMGQLPFSQLIGGLLSGDTLFHSWDLARATAQDDRLDAVACERVLSVLSPVDAAIRGPGWFADKIEPPAGADVQTRLLCFGGRRP